jgi:hypothetical protein
METIKQVFNKFLKEQEQRLSQRTYKRYFSIIDLFETYLNRYAYNYLSEEKHEKFNELYNNEKQEFCEIFGIEEVSSFQIEEFFDFFLAQKVIASQSLIKNAGTVLRKLVKWFNTNGYIDDQVSQSYTEIIDGLKGDLSKVVKLSDLLAEEAHNNSYSKFELYTDGQFDIAKVSQGKLYLEDMFGQLEKQLVIRVSEAISDAAQEGWSVYLELGKEDDEWYIIGSGSVSPI